MNTRDDSVEFGQWMSRAWLIYINAAVAFDAMLGARNSGGLNDERAHLCKAGSAA